MEEEKGSVGLRKSDLDIVPDHEDLADMDSDNSVHVSQVNAGTGNVDSDNVEETSDLDSKSTTIKLRGRTNTPIVSNSGPVTTMSKPIKDLLKGSDESLPVSNMNKSVQVRLRKKPKRSAHWQPHDRVEPNYDELQWDFEEYTGSDENAELVVADPPKSAAQTEINLQKIRDKATKFRSDVLENIESQLHESLEEFVQEIERIEQPIQINGTPVGSPRERIGRVSSNTITQRRKKGELPEKQFIARRSVLTELLEISHIQTIYHIFVAILIVFSLNTFVYDIIETGRLRIDFELIVWGFGKFPIVMSMWGGMTLSTVLIIYPLFQHWAHNRSSGKVTWQDYVWLSLYIAYQTVFFFWPIIMLRANKLPPVSSVIITCEQIRLLMKAHAFVRENIPRALNYDPSKGTEQESPCPGFSKYLYFLFAPTLVYRDDYPRTPKIRWNYVVTNFAQVLACLFYTYYIFMRFCIPVFHNFSQEHVTPKALILSTFGCMMPGTLVLFIGFFAILHSWLNAFAEMLRFGDRLFYKDWWNSSSFANYYRTWNVVVHDWLYSYIYKDCYKMFGTPSRPAAMASVFLLSAVFHEYILVASFGFFYPVLFVMFAGCGFAFIFVPNRSSRSGNVFMWVALFIGNGMLMCLYSLEWFARQNCPPPSDSFTDFLIPRSWTCDFTALKSNAMV